MKLVQLSGEKGEGKFAKVDDEDYEKVMAIGSWNYTKDGYACHSSRHKVYMHRVVMNAPKGMDVDHKNHDTLDNRKCNLRVCTHSENLKNRRNGIKGYYFSGRYQKWAVSVYGKYGGRYETEREAMLVANRIKSGQNFVRSKRKRPMLPRGVRLMKNCNKRPFGAVAKEQGRQIYIGFYKTAPEAEEAYKEYWKKRNGIL